MTNITKEYITAAADAYQAEVDAESAAFAASDLYDLTGSDEAYQAMLDTEAIYQRAQMATWDAEERIGV